MEQVNSLLIEVMLDMDPELSDYLLTLVESLLKDSNSDTILHLFTGTGSNTISKLILDPDPD